MKVCVFWSKYLIKENKYNILHEKKNFQATATN